MSVRYLVFMVFPLFFPATGAAQPSKELTAREEAALRELQKFQGRWQIVSQELDGKPTKSEELQERVMFFGADVFILTKGNDILQVGLLKLDPSKSPRTVNANVQKGLYKGETMLGIYEFEGDTLRMCFDIEGQSRPAEFKTADKEGRFLVTYRRVASTQEKKDDITGMYESTSIDAQGKKLTAQAEIVRHGDAYLVRYLKDGELAYIGVGLRKGDLFSVCWANRGEVGISVYRIAADGSMDGEYTRLGGIGLVDKESLTRPKPKK